jgi:release factor glutamine methyltransferase
MSTIQIMQLVHQLAAKLIKAGWHEREAQQDVWWMLEQILERREVKLLADGAVTWTLEHQQKIDHWFEQMINEKKPLQYILGTVIFCDLELEVQTPILIPRPETEEITLWLIDRIKRAQVVEFDIVDVCTGSGCIALALAAAFDKARVIGLDCNPQAIALANKNKERLKLSNVTFFESNLFDVLEPSYQCDIVVGNPPYLSESAYRRVTDQIRIWEDKKALVAANEGMELYESIASQTLTILKKNKKIESAPRLILEIGKEQVMIEKLLETEGYVHVDVYNDLNQMRRWVVADV